MKKLIFLLLLLPGVAFAQSDWEYATESSGNEVYYIKDVEKKAYGNKITFWIKKQNADKIVKTKKGSLRKAGDLVLAKWEGDCTEKTIETKMIVIYDNKGNSKGSDSGPFFAEPVVPDSIGESMLNLACKKIYSN